MGTAIDEHIGVIEDLKSTMSVCMPEPEKTEICTSLNEAIDTMRKYQQLQADYEKRLKADMVAMLDELDLELYEQYDDTDLIKVKYVRQAIQQKINLLKEAD